MYRLELYRDTHHHMAFFFSPDGPLLACLDILPFLRHIQYVVSILGRCRVHDHY